MTFTRLWVNIRSGEWWRASILHVFILQSLHGVLFSGHFFECILFAIWKSTHSPTTVLFPPCLFHYLFLILSQALCHPEQSSPPVSEVVVTVHPCPFELGYLCGGCHWRFFPYLVFYIPDGWMGRAFLHLPNSMNGGTDSRLLMFSYVSSGSELI